ncbi:MAG: NINE protein [Achromobacter sp.]
MSQTATFAASPPAPRKKVMAGLLACFFGAFGAHWWYLGRRGAWGITLYTALCLAWSTQFPVWWDSPAFFLVFIPMIAGFIEGVVVCLFTDEKFDRVFNQGRAPAAPTGWGPVLVAILTTLVGATVGMFGIAMVVVYVYTAMGWLDGLVL